jgi:phosphate-selective porin OprO and OprP
MKSQLFKWVGGALVCSIACLSLARPIRAQDNTYPLPASTGSAGPGQAALGAPQDPNGDLRARIERLERQNQELMQALRSATSHVSTDAPATSPAVNKDDVQKIVTNYLADKDADKKQAAAANCAESPDGYKVGSILGVTAAFNEWGYLWITTPNKDFTMHPGYWVQYDNVFWTQSPALRTAPDGKTGNKQGVASGPAQGGIGDLEDGTFFRRIRPFVEGTFWENYEYRLNLALENDQFETTGLDEFWVAVNKVPVVGTIRAGHVKTVNGLEADMTASSRAMTFMERSSYSESIELNQNFVTGAWLHNDFIDEHMTYTASIFRTDQGASSGVFFGDGQYGAGARWTFLPIYECEGRHWLHLGISGGWRNGTNNLATSPDRTFQLRARPELRDDDPASSPSGGQPIPNANSTRMVDTGVIAAEDDWILGLELLYVRGPFSVQAEWGWNFLSNAYGANPSGFTLNPPIIPKTDYTFTGGYIQLAYSLTGEARGYDRKAGTIAREYFSRPGVLTNAWLLRGEDGRLTWGIGAWELAARYSFVDLNDGSGLNRIQGGVMDGWSAGLNWYLNNNVKLQFDYIYNQRHDLPVGVIPGTTQGFGTRVQLTF